ncbi:MAG TPA: discoidin domain-containing protein, partial [Vicinamibacteria bacterium]
RGTTMAKTSEGAAREARQARVAKAVWGVFFLTMGGLFMLDNLGRIALRGSGSHPAANAVDGDPATRWSSEFGDPQWITVDLGSVREISRVKLSWEKAFGRAYRIEVSTDGDTFVPVREVTDADGDVDEYDVQTSGRYLRVTGTERATQYGYSLWELEVFGPTGPLSPGRPTRASSAEGGWFLYWPLLMIASGLPALIAPKDGGDQVVGLLLAGTGVLFQLQMLEIVRWTFGQAWPILLIVAGFLLVTQALRQMERSPADSGGAAGGDSGGAAR